MSQPPDTANRGGGPPIAIVAAIAVAVILVVVLHLTGVVGPGAH